MRSTAFFTVLACLLAVQASPTKVVLRDASLPVDSEIVSWPGSTTVRSWSARDPGDLTNAARIQKGLPLAPPKIRKQKRLSPAPSTAAGVATTYVFSGQCHTLPWGCVEGDCTMTDVNPNGKTKDTATSNEVQSYVDTCGSYCSSRPFDSFLAGWYSGGTRFYCICGYAGEEAPCTNDNYSYARYVRM